MYKSLSPGAIGIHGLSLAEGVDLARASGFEGLDFSIQQAAVIGAEAARALFDEAGIRCGAWGLPVRWNADGWRDDLAQLPRYADVAARMGADRTSTWCPPSSADRPYAENYQWHLERFAPIAEVLRGHGIRFGIEFIGPQSLRPPDKHSFIYTMEGMLGLAADIGAGNVGLLLDAWHLYTSGGALDDLDKISNADIVNVHVNDAPLGLGMAEYIDNDRRLPCETGVMPLAGFMRKLAALGYDGPVTPEPFSARLNAIEDPGDAADEAVRSMRRLWDVASLA